MIEELKSILKDDKLLVYLKNHQLWSTKQIINNPKPRIEEIFMPIDDMVLSIQVIHQSNMEGDIFSKTPNSFSRYILPISGKYERSIAYEKCDEFGNAFYVVMSNEIIDGSMFYEMDRNNSNANYINPLIKPLFTINLIKTSFKSCNNDKNLVILSTERKKEILLTFKNYFE